MSCLCVYFICRQEQVIPKSKIVCLHGLSTGIKCYKLLDFHTHELFIYRDVVFHEDVFPFKTSNPAGFNSDPFDTLALPGLDHPPYIFNDHTSISPPLLPDTIDQDQNANVHENVPIIPSRKSSRQSKKPSYLLDYHYNLATHTTHASTNYLYPISMYSVMTNCLMHINLTFSILLCILNENSITKLLNFLTGKKL